MSTAYYMQAMNVIKNFAYSEEAASAEVWVRHRERHNLEDSNFTAKTSLMASTFAGVDNLIE